MPTDSSRLNTIVTVNVGGHAHTTYWSTLLMRTHSPDTLFHSLFDTQHDNNVFIDRDSDIFASLLRFLRTGHVSVPTSVSLQAYVEEVEDYYGYNLPKTVKLPLHFPPVVCLCVYEIQKYSYERGIQMQRELRVGRWEPASFPLIDTLRRCDLLHVEDVRSMSPVHTPVFGSLTPQLNSLHISIPTNTTMTTAQLPLSPTPGTVSQSPVGSPSSTTSAKRPGREVITALLNLGYKLENSLLLGQTMYPLRSPDSFSNNINAMVDKGLFSQLAVFRRNP